MTKAQERVFRYVFNFIQLMNRPPTYEEISIGTKKSKSNIYKLLKKLQKHKYIDYEKGKLITLKILKVW